MAEDNSETPNADAVEAFLQKQKDIKEEGKLDPEMAKKEAQRLAKMMDEITRLMQDYPGPTPSKVEIAPKVFLERGESQLRVSSYIEDLSGIGGKFITFMHNFKVYPNNFPEKVGVDTLNRLDIGIHTDIATREQVEQLENPHIVNPLQSIYFFD